MILKKSTLCCLAIMLFVISIPQTFSWEITKYEKIADVLIYSGPGAWDDGVIAFEKFLEFKGLTWYECNGDYFENNNLIDSFYAIHFPGGNSGYYIENINSVGLQNIRDFVSSGGGYIGICAGGYFACDRIIWEGHPYDQPLDLFFGIGYGAIDEIAPWPSYATTTININPSNPINKYEPANEYILYYGGAAFYPDEGQEMNVIGTYNSFNDDPAIINFNYGDGRVVLFGPHPEIEEDSTRDEVIFGDNLEDLGTDWNIMWTCIDWLLGLPISEPPEQMPPNIPKILGQKRGIVGKEIEYTFSSDDPEEEELYYYIEWGDGDIKEWIGPYKSGENVKIGHLWSEGGMYTIKAKAKDAIDMESDWETFKVNIPRIRIVNNSWVQRLFERFANAFLLIRQTIDLLPNCSKICFQ